MARSLRIHVPGGFYHVTLRGNHQQPIFFASSDRDLLDEIVSESVETSGLRIHAYCWMTNHLHLLAQVSDIPLGRAILRIASRYARTVQRRLETTGHLFERRYHCTIVDEERYLLTLLRYIHLNPVKAGLVQNPFEYQWSSHRNYVGNSGKSWVTTSFALNMLGATRDCAVLAYHALMGSSCNTGWNADGLRLNANYDGILGDDAFAARVGACRVQARSKLVLEDLIAVCCDRFGITEADLVGRTRSQARTVARAWLAREATSRSIASVSAVARRLGRTEGAVRQILLRVPASEGERDTVGR